MVREPSKPPVITTIREPSLKVTKAVTLDPVAELVKAVAPFSCVWNPCKTNRVEFESAPTSHPFFTEVRRLKPLGVLKAAWGRS